MPPLKEIAKKANREDLEEESETPSARRKEKGKEKEIYRNSYASTKQMPPLKETAKKAYCESCEEESDTPSARRKEKGKGKEKVAHQQEETTGIQFLSLGASIKPRPEKPGSKHGKRLDFYLNKYRDEMAGQDEDEEGEGEEEEREEEEGEEEEGVGYPGVSERAEPLSRKRSFGEADLHPSDESETRTLGVRRSRRIKPDTGGRLNTPAPSRRLGRLG